MDPVIDTYGLTLKCQYPLAYSRPCMSIRLTATPEGPAGVRGSEFRITMFIQLMGIRKAAVEVPGSESQATTSTRPTATHKAAVVGPGSDSPTTTCTRLTVTPRAAAEAPGTGCTNNESNSERQQQTAATTPPSGARNRSTSTLSPAGMTFIDLLATRSHRGGQASHPDTSGRRRLARPELCSAV